MSEIFQQFREEPLDQQIDQQVVLKSFFSSVYSYMFMALVVSGIVSWYVAESGLFVKLFLNVSAAGEVSLSPIFYVFVFAPVGLAIWMQARFHKFNMSALVFMFVLYSVLIGISLSSIFLVYSSESLISTFFITGGAFAAMAILGYTTSVDLSKMGSLLYMAFIGIFIAAIVNMFLGSSALGFAISIIGVFVFTGLTAWEMQRLKALALDPAYSGEEKRKLTLIGGLTLYILFINLFLSLLNLLGRD
jgi:FtsH-binding integral membrane protein